MNKAARAFNLLLGLVPVSLAAQTVTVTSPTAASTVSDDITLRVSLTSFTAPPASVEYVLNDGIPISGPIRRPPYTYLWRTSFQFDQAARIKAIARTALGSVIATSASVAFTIDNKADSCTPTQTAPTLPAGTVSGSMTWTLDACAPSASSYTYRFFVDEVQVRSFDTASQTHSWSFDTTTLLDGLHLGCWNVGIQVEVAVGAEKDNPYFGEGCFEFTTNNTTSVREIQANYKTLWLTVGGATAQLASYDALANGTRSASSSPSYASANSGVCSVTTPGGVVTPVATGATTITITSGTKTNIINCFVFPSGIAAAVRHYQKESAGCTVSTSYDASKSIIPISLFNTGTLAFSQQPTLGSDMIAAGFNTLETGLASVDTKNYANFANWQTAFDAALDTAGTGILNIVNTVGFRLWLPFDGFPLPSSGWETQTAWAMLDVGGWSTDPLVYTFQRFRDSGKVCEIAGMDETDTHAHNYGQPEFKASNGQITSIDIAANGDATFNFDRNRAAIRTQMRISNSSITGLDGKWNWSTSGMSLTQIKLLGTGAAQQTISNPAVTTPNIGLSVFAGAQIHSGGTEPTDDLFANFATKLRGVTTAIKLPYPIAAAAADAAALGWINDSDVTDASHIYFCTNCNPGSTSWGPILNTTISTSGMRQSILSKLRSRWPYIQHSYPRGHGNTTVAESIYKHGRPIAIDNITNGVLTTSVAHGLATKYGEATPWYRARVTGNSLGGYNTTWYIGKVLSATTAEVFKFSGEGFANVAGGGATIQCDSTGVLTINEISGSGVSVLTTVPQVEIGDHCTVSGHSDSNYNGTWIVKGHNEGSLFINGIRKLGSGTGTGGTIVVAAGGDIDPRYDAWYVGAVRIPHLAILQNMYAMQLGYSSLRIYNWHHNNTVTGFRDNMPEATGTNTTLLQGGIHAKQGDEGVRQRWYAEAFANLLINRLAPVLLGTMLPSPDYGSDITTGVRETTVGRSLTACNWRRLAVTIPSAINDYSAYVYSGGSISKYTIGYPRLETTVATGTSENLTIPGYGCVAYVFLPSGTRAWVQPVTFGINLFGATTAALRMTYAYPLFDEVNERWDTHTITSGSTLSGYIDRSLADAYYRINYLDGSNNLLRASADQKIPKVN